MFVQYGVRGAGGDGDVAAPALSVEACCDSDRLDKRRLAASVLAREERHVWVDLEFVELPDRGDRERVRVEVVHSVAPFAMSQPAISKHLKVLERAGLISGGRDAQRRPRRIEGESLAGVTGWLERYRKVWEGNFEDLDNLLEEMKTKEKTRRRKKR